MSACGYPYTVIGSPGPEASRSEAEVSMHEGLGKGVYGGKVEKGK